MKNLLCIILFITGFLHAKSQVQSTSTEKYLELNGGIQKRILLDEQKSALVYASNQAIAGLEFGRIAPKSVLRININAGTGNYVPRDIHTRWVFTTTYDIHGTPEMDSFPVIARMISGSIQLSYQKRIHTSGKFIWLAGGSVKNLLLYPDNYIGLLNSLGLYLNIGVMQNGTKSRFLSEISFPLLAVNTRLPWHNTATSPDESEVKTFFNKGSRWVSVDKYKMIEFDVKYDFKLTSKWNIGASYEFIWLNIPYYQPLRTFSNTFKLQTAIIL